MTIYENMKNGVEPFNNIDLIYTSHTHTCHFDAVLLFNTMKNNPKAISIMSQDVKKAMKQYFTDNPDLLDRVFAPEIPLIRLSTLHWPVLKSGLPTLCMKAHRCYVSI